MRRLRAARRLKLFQPTELRTGEARCRVHLLDLSATGALIHAAAPPARGASVLLACAGSLREARVMWVDGQRLGVSFRSTLTNADLARALNAPAPAQGVR